MSSERPDLPPVPGEPPRPWARTPAPVEGFTVTAVPAMPVGTPTAGAIPAQPQPQPQPLPPAAPWASGPGAGSSPATGRMRRIAQDLPAWEPLPPGETTVRRPGTAT
ncbi:hypothetical protein AB0G48_03250 [Streptomyces rubiginosohelvolus]|uniref:hypothetical protein n=1 Tax=Streptomyces rubiginosohelvolus TaxID=67362 RepID=UPI0033C1CDFD